MKKQEINSGFLISKMEEAAAENRKLITRLRHELQFDVDYDTFDSLMLQITGGISYDLDIVDEYIYTEEKKAHIKKCANKYMGIIAGFPAIFMP